MRLRNFSVAAVVVATLVSGCGGNRAGSPVGGPDGGGGAAPDAATAGTGGAGGSGGSASGGQGGAPAGAMKPIGPEGGSVAEPSGTAVVIPAGGLAQTTMIGVSSVAATGSAAGEGMPGLPAGVTPVGDVFALTPHGVAFAAPATVHVVYDPARAAPATGALRLYTASEAGSWKAVDGAAPTAGAVEAQVSHFSFFVVGFEAPGQTLPEPQARKLDILFVIDNSQSMAPLQQKLLTNFPVFMQVLKGLPSGLPDLHIGVISSSMGAGQFDTIPNCPVGGDGGRLQFAPRGTCTATGLHDNFIAATANEATKNYDGTIEDTFSCIALLGDTGCGFEHQLESVAAALGAHGPAPAENNGFLRPDALLAVVIVTNEDDCSAPSDSPLFDPMQLSVTDPLGPLWSYRCNEYGHLCNGAPPPRTVAASFAPGQCVPAEGAGMLTPVATLLGEIKGVKSDPSQILVSLIAGPPDPYAVMQNPASAPPDMTNNLTWPSIGHSCMQNSGEYGDPAIRLQAFVDGFGANGQTESICEPSFGPALSLIAASIGQAVGPLCLQPAVVEGGTVPPALKAGCAVFESLPAAGGTRVETALPPCLGGAAVCYSVGAQPGCTTTGASIAVNRPGPVPPGAVVVVRCQP